MVSTKGIDAVGVVLQVLAVAFLLAGSGVVGMAHAGTESESSFKIDVGIYAGVNPVNNPINADPGDMQQFHFDVSYVITRTPQCVLPFFSPPSESGVIDQFTVSQGNTVFVPKVVGQAGDRTINYCVLPLPLVGYSYPADSSCLGVICPVTESVSYTIDHYDIPKGYCPQYPDGQDRKKEATQTENMKFYKGSACGKVYAGWDGHFGWGPCKPRQCYIMIT